MADLAKLRFQRGQLKSKLTRARQYFESLDLSKLDEVLITELSVRLEKLVPCYDQFNDIQSKIELANLALADNEINETDAGALTEFEEQYFRLISNMKIAILPSATNEVTVKHQLNASGFSGGNQQSQAIKLPTIKMPSFSGQLEHWLEFRDAFNALIHENDQLSDIQKFYYLQSSLEKEASNIIQSIKVTSINYKIAWKLLQDRFENKRLIIHSHVKSIFELPPIKKESHVELRNLFDNITRHLRCLKSLGEATDSWDTLIIYIITSKFDSITRREWEQFNIKTDLPTMEDNKFLKLRCELLETLKVDKHEYKNYNNFNGGKRHKSELSAYVCTDRLSCYYCKKHHTIYQCEAFLKLSPSARINEVKKLKLCINSLKPTHLVKDCQSSNCRKCNKAHNTMLHIDIQRSHGFNSSNENIENIVTPSSDVQTVTMHTISDRKIIPSQVVLSTAIVFVADSTGKLHECRALLDNASMSNFCTEAFCKKLNLPLESTNFSVVGVGQAMSNIQYTTNFVVQSRNNAFNEMIDFLVMPKITEKLPMKSFNKSGFDIPRNIKLADPKFNQSMPVDLLLGASVFWKLLCVGQFQLEGTQLTIQKTRLGWILGGSLNIPNKNRSINCLSLETNSHLDNNITKFWQIEEICPRSYLSESERFCENHFVKNLTRNKKGQFIVSIPFNDKLSQLGSSREFALKRFYAQERKLQKNTDLYNEYKKFMLDYELLGHMIEINDNDCNDASNYYLPHRAVVKSDSITTKVRVVFDASMKTDSGLSLNDVQHCGPTIQNDLFSIILRFRKHTYVMTADISKMYRMIFINSEQRRFQRIFWRRNPSQDVKCFELSTVTYGTASAPLLAIRALLQVAIENEKDYQEASEVLKHDFYVDDCLTGSDSKNKLIQLQHDLSKILSSYGFELRKWLTNKKNILTKFDVNDKLDSSILALGDHETNKTLGIQWNASFDTIEYSIGVRNQSTISKRSILSTISQIFDPLGLLGPIIIQAKLLMQKLWQAKLSWDESIPQNLQTTWVQFCNELQYLNNLRIPRHVIGKNYKSIELHGFSDASERAYGACVYIKTVNDSGRVTSHLLCAKSKLAPIKQVTLPRLELCGAMLLAHLVQKIHDSMKIKFDCCYLWSDSTITLAWIQGDPNKKKTFGKPLWPIGLARFSGSPALNNGTTYDPKIIQLI